jgi:dipeptidyl aminopeptidase/acylaminoacyl peptidase
VRIHTWFAAALCLSIATLHAAESAADPVPLDIYGRLPSLEDAIVSPDGKRIAYVKTKGNERILAVVGLDPAAVLGGVEIGETKLRSAKWIDGDRILLTLSGTWTPMFSSQRAYEQFHLLMYDVKSHTLKEPSFKIPDARTYDIAASTTVRNIDGEANLFVHGWLSVNRRVNSALYQFSGDRHATIVEINHLSTNWLLDERGRIAAQLTFDSEARKWEISTRSGDRTAIVATGTADIEIPHMVGFSAAGDAIIVSFPENGDFVLKPLYLKDNSWGPALEKGESFDLLFTGRTTGRIFGGVPDINHSKLAFFDNETQAHWNAVQRAFPGEEVDLASHSDDFSKIVVKVFGAKDGFEYALYDWNSHQATPLGQIYAGLGRPAEVRKISYPAADGLDIPALLTLPSKEAKGLPLVVLPHGGPAAADFYSFDWWAQALAAEGYVVLQPNYRGSTLGFKFQSAGFGEYGRKMQTDLSDGVRYLAQQGIIDPARVCIVGASYGGYAALAGVTLQNGIYRCAVSVSGVSDLKRHRKISFSGESNAAMRYWDRYMGASYQSDPALVEISPIEHVERVNVPVLLIHGKGDGVVPYEQSEVMASALKRAGKSVQFLTLGEEDHWLSRSETRLQMLKACVDFLRTNNPPD